MSGRIVVGFDGTDTGVIPVRWAVEEAARRGAVLVAVTCWQNPVTGYGGPAPTLPAEYVEQLEIYSRDQLELALTEAGALQAGIPIERVCSQATPVEALLAQSRDADLVVVGGHQWGALHRLVVGSVSHAVVQRSACPVVVVPVAKGTPA